MWTVNSDLQSVSYCINISTHASSIYIIGFSVHLSRCLLSCWHVTLKRLTWMRGCTKRWNKLLIWLWTHNIVTYTYFMYKYWQMNDIGDGDISCLVNHRSTQMHHNIMCLYQLQQLRIHTLLKNITQHTQCTLKSF